MNVGVIGLGDMGAPMARNLLKGGHRVTVYARRPEQMKPIADLGARTASSPADVAASSEVTVVVVTDAAAVESVTLGANGIVAGALPATTVIDHSTIDPASARRISAALEARGIDMLDAPVSGGAAVAEQAALTIMVGGKKDAFDRCRPVLGCYGVHIVHVGPAGAGQIAKACNQICTVVNMLGVAEALLLAERAGMDSAVIRDVIATGFGASRMLDVQSPKMIARDFAGRIESRLHHKDIHIVLQMAQALGVSLPGTAAAAQVFDLLQDRGGARHDSAAIFDVLGNP